MAPRKPTPTPIYHSIEQVMSCAFETKVQRKVGLYFAELTPVPVTGKHLDRVFAGSLAVKETNRDGPVLFTLNFSPNGTEVEFPDGRMETVRIKKSKTKPDGADVVFKNDIAAMKEVLPELAEAATQYHRDPERLGEKLGKVVEDMHARKLTEGTFVLRGNKPASGKHHGTVSR